MRGKASDYAKLALRAITRKTPDFFRSHSEIFLNQKKTEEQKSFKNSGPYEAMFTLVRKILLRARLHWVVKHVFSYEARLHWVENVFLPQVRHEGDSNDFNLMWLMLSSVFNLRLLQISGYFIEGEERNVEEISYCDFFHSNNIVNKFS